MPTISPFKGLRYNTSVISDISKVVAPPYDIIYDEWREMLYERHPNNIVRLIKSKSQSDDDEINNKYTRARDHINSWMSEGVLILDEKPSIYVRSDTYKVGGETKTRYGFISLIKLEDFGKGIHPHEKTLSAPKVDRLNLIKETKTNLSQIFSIYSDTDNKIQDILLKVAAKSPVADFTDEQDIHRKIWIVDDEETISEMQSIMKDREVIIADGHHRYETSLAYKEFMEPLRKSEDEPFDYVSMYFSSADDMGMTILPTHRKVGGLETFDEKKMFEALEKDFDITYYDNVELDEMLNLIKDDSERTNVFGIYTVNGYAVAKLKNPSEPKRLDVELLHTDIIEKILGITPEETAKGKYLHFCKSPDHAYDEVASGKDQVSFFMNAIVPEELFRVVLNGKRMPQKSTYFYPKTMSGLVMYKVEKESFNK
ncbi:DUF1015 domain-containing protein [Candidatus Latescibacterota bacterium]